MSSADPLNTPQWLNWRLVKPLLLLHTELYRFWEGWGEFLGFNRNQRTYLFNVGMYGICQLNGIIGTPGLLKFTLE